MVLQLRLVHQFQFELELFNRFQRIQVEDGSAFGDPPAVAARA